MSHETIAALFWSLLALSLAGSMVALMLRTWRLMLAAGLLMLLLVFPAIFSIGFVLLIIALTQLLAAWALRRGARAPGS